MTSSTAITRKELRQFGMVMAAGLAVVCYGVLPWIFGLRLMLWPGLVALLFLALAWVYPTGLKYIYTPWMKLAHVLGRVNTVILLSLVFFLMITPMGILARIGKALFGKQPDNSQSYKKPSVTRDSTHLEKPY